MHLVRSTRLAVSILGCLTLVDTASAQDEPRRSITEIVDGVYHATNNNHGTVFMVTSDGIVLSDPIRPDFSAWLKLELEARFGVPVQFVLYSHHHWDHASGGEVFADTAQFVGHANMPAYLEMPPASTKLTDVIGQEAPIALLDVDGDGLVSRAEGQTVNPFQFDGFDEDNDGAISGAELMRGALSNVHPPTITYTDEIEVSLGGKRVRMEWLGEFNHSFDSSMISFPDQSVLFLVDFVTFGRMPHTEMDYELGLYEEWMDAIRMAEERSRSYDYVVTGHGPVGSSENVTEWREYFDALESAVASGIAEGQTLEEMMDSIELPEWSHWINYESWLPLNVRGMYHFLTD